MTLKSKKLPGCRRMRSPTTSDPPFRGRNVTVTR